MVLVLDRDWTLKLCKRDTLCFPLVGFPPSPGSPRRAKCAAGAWCLVSSASIASKRAPIDTCPNGICSTSHHHYFNIPRLKCHNKCTKDAPLCRISILTRKQQLMSFVVIFFEYWMLYLRMYVLCKWHFFTCRAKNTSRRIGSIGHQQSDWSDSCDPSAVCHFTPCDHQKGKEQLFF